MTSLNKPLSVNKEHTYSPSETYKTVNMIKVEQTDDNRIVFGGPREHTQDLGAGRMHVAKEWLNHPQQIASIPWVTGTSLNVTINPWVQYFTLTNVRSKLEHAKLLRGDLIITAQINGGIMYSGRVVMSYEPHAAQNTSATLGLSIDSSPISFIPLTSLPHVWLDPTQSRGGELYIHYMAPTNWFDVTTAGWAGAGTLYLRSVGNLQSSNSLAGDLTITVFAHLENVEVSGLTAVLQSGTEPPERLVSKPLAAAAAMAGALSKIPIISPYATASQMLLSSLGKIAQLFGYSRPVLTADPVYALQKAGNKMANVDQPEHIDVLAFDSKCQLTLDPRTVGMKPADELALSSLVQHESLITVVPWSTTTTPSTVIMTSVVCPVQYSVGAPTAFFQMTPMCHATLPFKYWSGTIIYRFVCVVSGLQRGRLRIHHDPTFNLGVTFTYPSFGVVEQIVWDIAESKEIEVHVKWTQPQAYARVPQMLSTGVNTAPPIVGPLSLSTATDTHNGLLRLSVLNELTTPGTVTSSTSDGTILVFARAGPDFRVAVPRTVQPLTYAAVQSGIELTGGDVVDSMVYFGDPILSWRSVMKRYILNSRFIRPGIVGGVNYNRIIVPALQPISNATATNPSRFDPVAWMYPCFLGWRGARRWKIVATSTDPGVMVVARGEPVAAPLLSGSAPPPVTQSEKWGGCAISHTAGQIVEVETPYYGSNRYTFTRIASGLSVDSLDIEVYGGASDATESVYIMLWTSVGEDFQLFGYLYPPRVFVDV